MNYTIEHQRVFCLSLFHLIISKVEEEESNQDKLLLKTVDIASIIPVRDTRGLLTYCNTKMPKNNEPYGIIGITLV